MVNDATLSFITESSAKARAMRDISHSNENKEIQRLIKDAEADVRAGNKKAAKSKLIKINKHIDTMIYMANDLPNDTPAEWLAAHLKSGVNGLILALITVFVSVGILLTAPVFLIAGAAGKLNSGKTITKKQFVKELIKYKSLIDTAIQWCDK